MHEETNHVGGGEAFSRKQEIVKTKPRNGNMLLCSKTSKEVNMPYLPNLLSCHSPKQNSLPPDLVVIGQLCRHCFL